MDGEHFSCDEEDYDTFSSVSQPGGQVLYDSHYSSWNDDQEHDVPPPAVQGTPDSFSLCRNNKTSEDIETSSQVARSIISGLFLRITGQEDITTEITSNSSSQDKLTVVPQNPNDSRSTKLDFEGSDCSNVEYQIGDHMDPLETSTDNPNADTMFETSGFEVKNELEISAILDEYQPPTRNITPISSKKSLTGPTSKVSAGSKSESQEQMQELTRANSSFTARITDWINTVSIKEDVAKEISYQESVQCSTPAGNVTMEDCSDVYSDDDDQPAGYTSPVRTLANTSDTPKDLVPSDDFQSLDEIRNNFQSEARTNIISSLVPTSAFKSFDQGFSNVQVSNGKELFDNGLIRHRQTGNYIKSIPYSQESSPRNYHFKITETSEQTVKLNTDGSQIIETNHKREQSEKSFDQDKRVSSFLKLFLVLVLLMLVLACVLVLVLQYLELVHIKGLSCFMEKNGFPPRFDASKKAYIEI